MTEDITPSTPGPEKTPPENQRQRWIKYGANVVLSTIVVIAIAALVIYLAESHNKQFDTTMGGTQSLRPQTVDFLKNLGNHKVKIVAVYPQLKHNSNDQDYYTPVADLLHDYAVASPNITVQMLDPDNQKDDFNKLVQDVTNNFGGEAASYKKFLDDFPASSDELSKFGTDEVKTMKALPLDQVTDQAMGQNLTVAILTMISIPRDLSDLKDAIASDTDTQVPSYKDAVDEARTALTNIQQYLGGFTQAMEGVKADTKLPKEILDYAPQAETRAATQEKTVQDLLDQIGKLPPLKELVEFRDQLKTKSIIVMVDSGQKDAGYKVLQFSDVWRVPDVSRFTEDNSSQQRLNFEAEQQVTSSIASLTSGEKPMVVFVRSGGSPVTTATPDGQEGYFSSIAQRLKEYNFDVEEKDASGQDAQQGGPPEPTDDQMKTAIWVVLPSQVSEGMAPSPIGDMLKTHLDDGGSALVMLSPTADDMKDTLAPWGLQCDTRFMLVHEAQHNGARKSADPIEQAAQANQAVLVLSEYGNHPLATPLQGLAFLTYGSAPVTTLPNLAPGIKATGILPMPSSPHCWASSTAMQNVQQGLPVAYDPRVDVDGGHPLADIDNSSEAPLFAAGASDKTNGGRVVVAGSVAFAANDILNIADENRPDVTRFPGDGEFFMDSIFWLGHMDTMLAISPHALSVARISDMSPASQVFWRVGVLTAGLPAAVILLGTMVYVKRRD